MREPCSYYQSVYEWGRTARRGWLFYQVALAEGRPELYPRAGTLEARRKAFADWVYFTHFGAELQAQARAALEVVEASGVAAADRRRGLPPWRQGPSHLAAGEKAWLLEHRANTTCGILSTRLWAALVDPGRARAVNQRAAPKGCHQGLEQMRTSTDQACPCPLAECSRAMTPEDHAACRRETRAAVLGFDCWIRTDALDADFVACMDKYRARGGQIDNATLSAWLGKSRHMSPHKDSCDDLVIGSGVERLVQALEAPYLELFSAPRTASGPGTARGRRRSSCCVKHGWEVPPGPGHGS